MVSTRLKNFAKSHPLLYLGGVLFTKLYNFLRPVRGINNKILLRGNIINLKKSILGNDNLVDVRGATILNVSIRIRGNGNTLIIEEGCIIGDQCSFWLEGNNNKIIVGKKTTMTLLCHLNAQEHNTTILVGEDCMLSNTIIIRTSDSHPIYDKNEKRINHPKDVKIGSHVWIAPNSVVMKGAVIGDGCIVGSHSMVNKVFPNNALLVGTPAKVVKEDVHWTRENVLK